MASPREHVLEVRLVQIVVIIELLECVGVTVGVRCSRVPDTRTVSLVRTGVRSPSADCLSVIN